MLKTLSKKRQWEIKWALQETFGVTECKEYQLLAGGYSSSQTYKIFIKGNPYVLRIMGLDQDLKDREQQITCLKIAAEHDIAPRYYYGDAKAGIVIMDYIEAQALSSCPKESLLSQIANYLRRLHKSTDLPMTYYPLFAYMDSLISNLKKYPLADFLLSYLENICGIQTLLLPHLTYSSCHNDLNSNNILFDGSRIYLIDWEAAGKEDPLFDLATICNQLIFDKSEQDYFLKHYFDQINDFQMAKLYLMKQVSYCYSALHFLGFAAEAGKDLQILTLSYRIPTMQEWSLGNYPLITSDDFLTYALVQIKQSLTEISSTQFNWSKDKI